MSNTEAISASARAEMQCASAPSADSPPIPGDGIVDVHDFTFGDGTNLSSLKLHYLTLGTPRRDASDAITNGVLLPHGTAGSTADFAQAAFFDALYGAGQPLDLNTPRAVWLDPHTMPNVGLIPIPPFSRGECHARQAI